MSRTRTLLLTGVAVLLAAATASAQLGPGGTLAARPDRGVGTGVTYSVSEVDSVALTGGGLRLSIPLASLPPIAGGKLGVTISATYDSKLWDVDRREVRAEGTVGRRIYVVDEPRLSERGGWRISGPGYSFFLREAREDFYYDKPQQGETSDFDWVRMQHQWWRAYIVTPDGAEHELVPDFPVTYYDGDPTRTYMLGSFRDPTPGAGGPRRYHTTDSTYLTISVNPDATWEVTAPDGTRVTLAADGQRIIDSNGNSVRVYRDAATAITHYVDEQTGRELKVKEVEGGYQVWYQIVGGAWRHVAVNTGTTRVQGKLYRTNAWDAAAQTETGEQGMECVRDVVLDKDLPVFREIVFPATEPNDPAKRYTFAYNSDTTVQFPTDYRDVCGMAPRSHTFNSSPGLGELSQMTTPAGAAVSYTYSRTGAHRFQFNVDEITRNLITSKTVKDEAANTIGVWTYVINPDGSGGSVTNADGTSLAEEAYAADPAYGAYRGTDTGLGGKTYRTVRGNVEVERRWRSNPTGGLALLGPSGRVAVNPVVEAEYTSLREGGVPVRMSAKVYQYDLNGNLTQTKEYDWFDPTEVNREGGIPQGIPSNATLLREMNTSYYNAAAAPSSHNLYFTRATSGSTLVINAPQQTTVTGGSITKLSYDGQSYGAAPTRGNPTRVEQWDSAVGAWIETSATYDSYGNKETSTDANGNVTRYFYGDATHAMPTRVVVDPLNGAGAQETGTAYDFHTGFVKQSRDANGNVVDFDYTNHLLNDVDPFGRVGTVRGPADGGNGGHRRTVKTYYEDAARAVRTEADLRSEGDGLLKTRKVSDELGRAVLSQQSEDGVNYTVSVLSHFEEGGRITYASNPRREGVEAQTDGWTRTTRDMSGRVVEVATFAESARPGAATACSAATGCTGKVTTEYFAEYTTVTDQAGKQRRSATDAAGRIARVDEAGPSGSLGDRGAPARPTCYSFDAQSNLTRVRQGGQWQSQGGRWQCVGGQARSFEYSTLSRLSSAENPESGKSFYEYFPNGSLKKKIDPRLLPGTQTHVEVSYEYDGLNRVVSRSYNDGTPAVAYLYDSQPLPEGAPALLHGTATKGILRAVIYGAQGSTTGTYYGYDGLGRVSSSAQRTDAAAAGAQTYTMPEYRYDLGGSLISQTYPSGRVVKSEYDAAGRLAGVRGGESGPFYAGGAAADAANRIAYAAHGGVAAVRLGNGRWEHTSFNSRLQPMETGLGSSAADSSLLKLEYSYGVVTGDVLDHTRNSGNVQGQKITAPGLTLEQSYTYDELNRVSVARETSGQAQSWQQVYNYDAFGNRRLAHGTITPAVPVDQYGQLQPDVLDNPTISPATNRINADQGYGYDTAGNMTGSPGFTFGYDGENRMKSADNGQPSGLSTYSYDGEGRRVKKVTQSGAAVMVLVYDAFGKLVAEYGSAPQQSSGTQYLTADHLGSPRIITDSAGGVKARHDYFPFGEEIADGVGGRSTAQGYSQPDSVRQRFTSKERDDETGLDYFGARYYCSSHGRFTSTDPVLLNKRKLINPQRWNLYSYAINSPMVLIDPDGQQDQGKGGGIVIDVFLTRGPSDPKTSREETRRWDKLAERAKDKGITLNVHRGELDYAPNGNFGPGSGSANMTRANGALRNSDVVLFAPHSEGRLDGKFTSEQIPLVRGAIHEQGLKINEPSLLDHQTGSKPETNAKLVGLLTCNSVEMPRAFDGNPAFIINDGGKNGFTSVTALNQAAFNIVETIVDANGDLSAATIDKAVTAAQKAINASPQRDDKDGDRIRRPE